jgi:hypothetical protein
LPGATVSGFEFRVSGFQAVTGFPGALNFEEFAEKILPILFILLSKSLPDKQNKHL